MRQRTSTTERTILCVLIAFSMAAAIPLASRSEREPTLELEESWQFSHPNIKVNDQFLSWAFPAIASDQFGRIFVVWAGGPYTVFSMSIDGGYTWSNSTIVNENYSHPTSPWSTNPDVATDGKNVYICWGDNTGSRLETYFKKSPIERIDFTHPDIVVSNKTSNDESDCKIVTDGRNVYITWEDQRHIYFDWSPVDNISFHDDTRVDTAPDDFFRIDPDIETDGKNIYIAWYDRRDNIGTLYSDIYFDWTPVDVLDFSGSDLLVTTGINETESYSPSVASDGKDVYIAWSDDRTHFPADMNIYMDHSPVDSLDFSSEDILVNDVWDPMNESIQSGPSIDACRGQVFLVWFDWRDPAKKEEYIYFDWTNTSNIDFAKADTMVSDKLDPAAGGINRFHTGITSYDDGLQTHVFVAWYDTRDLGVSQIYFAASPPRALYPDLSVNESEVVLTPSTPTQWTNVTINATVRDIGEMGVPNATITFFDGMPSLNKKIGESSISVLAHNKTYAEVNWVPEQLGNHEIYILADPDNKLNESSETNNVAIVSVNVKSLLPPTIQQATLAGDNLENVTICWSLSPDDGIGSKSVIGYGIYRGMAYDQHGLSYSLIASLPNGTSEFTDYLTGEGDPNNYFYQVCAQGEGNASACSKTQAGKFTRSLDSGVNLLSIPLVQSDEGVETVLQTLDFDKAWNYDSSMAEWKSYMTFKPYRGDLISTNHTIGIWVNVTNDCNLTVAGLVPLSTPMQLKPGWNLVGFPSFNSSYTVSDLKTEASSTRVERFDPSNPPYFLTLSASADKLQPGFGYWVRVEFETIWNVSNL